MKIVNFLLVILLFGLCALPVLAKDDDHKFGEEKLTSYLERLGMEYKHASEVEGAFILVKSEGVTHADRLVTLIVNDPDTEQLEILTYPEIEGKFLNVSKLANPEKKSAFYEQLARVNHKSFGMFFVDSDGDIGLRFTFSTENSVGFEAFRVVIENCQRVVDRFTPTIASFMSTEVGY